MNESLCLEDNTALALLFAFQNYDHRKSSLGFVYVYMRLKERITPPEDRISLFEAFSSYTDLLLRARKLLFPSYLIDRYGLYHMI